jgi:hypothetical protein
MSNVIHIDFPQAKRKKVLTLKAERSIVKGPLPKERVRSIAQSIERISKMLEVLKDESSTGSSRE